MTSSVLSACLFSIMVFGLPSANGDPLLRAPSPHQLSLMPPGDLERIGYQKTLVLGDADSEEVEVDVEVAVVGSASESEIDAPDPQPFHSRD